MVEDFDFDIFRYLLDLEKKMKEGYEYVSKIEKRNHDYFYENLGSYVNRTKNIFA